MKASAKPLCKFSVHQNQTTLRETLVCLHVRCFPPAVQAQREGLLVLGLWFKKKSVVIKSKENGEGPLSHGRQEFATAKCLV